jgi:signal transduction histidine kinase
MPREPQHYRAVLEDQLEELERLSRLAERLLFLCRGDAGLVPMSKQSVDLRDIVGKVAEHMRAVATEKGVNLVLDGVSPCSLNADEDQLRRLLFNLVDNAIKFTPAKGTVAINICCRDGVAQVEVADTGSGIPAEHLPHVFQRFYRVDPSREAEIGGTGLGLAIARSIAEAHGGSIVIESTAGVGTRVILTLPVKP